jgi:hypothetical protein
VKRTVEQHIEHITTVIDELETELSTLLSQYERLTLEADIKQLRLALQHLDIALEIERNVVEHRKSRGLRTSK